MKRWTVLVVLIAVTTAACGAADEAAAPGTTAEVAAPTTQASSTTQAPPTTQPPATTTSTTLAPTTTQADEIPTSPVVPGDDPDADAIVEAYLVVFDSATTYEEKAPFITDPSGLEDTVAKYGEAGDDLGGITLQADEVGIDGVDARVIYSFLFAGNTAYADLEGEALLTDAGWQVTREFFCEIMVSARVGCS